MLLNRYRGLYIYIWNQVGRGPDFDSGDERERSILGFLTRNPSIKLLKKYYEREKYK